MPWQTEEETNDMNEQESTIPKLERFYVSPDGWIEECKRKQSLVCVQGCNDDEIELLVNSLNFYEDSLNTQIERVVTWRLGTTPPAQSCDVVIAWPGVSDGVWRKEIAYCQIMDDGRPVYVAHGTLLRADSVVWSVLNDPSEELRKAIEASK